jgi:hypothetical protein
MRGKKCELTGADDWNGREKEIIRLSLMGISRFICSSSRTGLTCHCRLQLHGVEWTVEWTVVLAVDCGLWTVGRKLIDRQLSPASCRASMIHSTLYISPIPHVQITVGTDMGEERRTRYTVHTYDKYPEYVQLRIFSVKCK